MSTVAATVSNYLAEVWGRFVNALLRVDLMFIMGGFCPRLNRVVVYEFKVSRQDEKIAADYSEVLGTDDRNVYMFGSGATAAKSLLASNQKPLDALKAAIQDDSVPSVGGYVQYGRFEGAPVRFKVFSVEDYVVDHIAKELRTGFVYRGMPLIHQTGAVVQETIIRPYSDYIDDLLVQGYAAGDLSLPLRPGDT